MPISVTCACGNQFRAKDQFAGKTVKCPKCGKGVVVAGPAVAGCDVFLSYSSKDKAIADAACAALESRGIRCWVAPRDIIPGKEWGAAIIDGIEQSRSMVLLFSANANSSQQVMREVERAVNRGMPIIPFRIEDVPASKNMEYFISFHHWMDAFDGSLEEHLEQLAKTVRALLAGQTPGGQTGRTRASAPLAPARAGQSEESSGPRRGMSPVLMLLLALVIIGGGAAGFYVWSKRTPGKDDKTQQNGKDKQVVQGTPEATNLKGQEATNKTNHTGQSGSTVQPGAGNEKQRPVDKVKQDLPKKEPPKAVPGTPTVAYSEDLRTVEVGAYPKGWKCDPSVALFKGQDGKPYLHATKEGNHNLTTPDLGLRGDFYLEYEFEMGPGQLLEATLLGSDGSSNLSIKFDAGGGGNPADVHFPDSAPRHVLGIDGLATTRLRLERERNVFRVSLNGKPTHARRLSGLTEFTAVRFTMPGLPQIAKLFSFKAGPFSAQKLEAAITAASPEEAFRQGLSEDFKKVVAGDLPAGWDGDDALGVRQDGGRPRLEGCREGNLSVKLPGVLIRGDFFLECELELVAYQALEATLIGRDGGSSLPVKVDPGGGGSNSTVYFPDGSSDKVPQTVGMTVPLRIERKGEVFRISFNNKLVHAGRFEGCADFERVQLTMTGGTNSAKLYSVRLGPLGSK
ncbi:MAG TPA: toll/interleukin-1 receptor domain-containing protein [Gemmataceae bacterium]|nr:toll/interleukin-1 receptor domain-containing protein [Gemmataceae bacterium]